ncbi:hypothetical protein [Hymenobacter nivis]|uniref:hypothetical protein n=1 Tax=Hymenobacter nivis TaxID=1850093 RepID=UPI00112B077E|nr:hypothetical protein [Hymenobacter nivis]
MPAVTVPTVQEYEAELQVYRDAGWEVDFVHEPRQGKVVFRGQQFETGFQFSVEMERDVWIHPVMVPMFLQHSWHQVQEDMERQGLVMPALVVWTDNNRWHRPDSWGQLAGLINKIRVTPAELADASYRLRNKISMVYGPVGRSGDNLYEMDIVDLPDYLGSRVRAYVRKVDSVWQLIDQDNLVLLISAADQARHIVNYHNLRAGEFTRAFPEARL